MTSSTPAPTTSSSPRASSKSTTSGDAPTGRWQVRLSHPNERKRVVFSSVSERRARAHVQNRYPRGEEAYLEGPDGTTESYQHERTGPHGEDADQWASFDPETYQPPEEQTPPGEAAWADVGGN
jgi:hypothetical protein